MTNGPKSRRSSTIHPPSIISEALPKLWAAMLAVQSAFQCHWQTCQLTISWICFMCETYTFYAKVRAHKNTQNSFKNFKDPTKIFKQIQAPNNPIFLGLNAFDFWQIWPKTWKLNHYPFSNILLLEIILLQKHDHDGRLEHCICICECVCVCALTTMPMVRATYIYICELWASAKLVVFFPLPTCIINAGSDKNRRGGCTIEKYREV